MKNTLHSYLARRSLPWCPLDSTLFFLTNKCYNFPPLPSMWWVAPTFWAVNHFRHQLIRKYFTTFIQCSWEKLPCNILPHSILARVWHQNAAILREPAWARAIFSLWGPHYFFLKCLGRCTREDIWAPNCFSGKEVFNLSKKQNLFRFFYFLGQIWQLVVFEEFAHCSQIFTFFEVRLSLSMLMGAF